MCGYDGEMLVGWWILARLRSRHSKIVGEVFAMMQPAPEVAERLIPARQSTGTTATIA